MEKSSLPNSTKNIPVPSDKTYMKIMINKVEKFVHNFRWKANFFLKPETKPQKKQTFGFRSTAASPFVTELKDFEDKLVSLIKSIEFRRRKHIY